MEMRRDEAQQKQKGARFSVQSMQTGERATHKLTSVPAWRKVNTHLSITETEGQFGEIGSKACARDKGISSNLAGPCPLTTDFSSAIGMFKQDPMFKSDARHEQSVARVFRYQQQALMSAVHCPLLFWPCVYSQIAY